MLYEYEIYNKTTGEMLGVIKAFSPSHALNTAFMKFGSASRYSGLSADDFRIRKI